MSPRKKKLAEYGNVFEEMEKEQSDHEPNEPNQVPAKKKTQTKVPDYLEKLQQDKTIYVDMTYGIEQELVNEIEATARRYGHGFKKKFANAAFRNELDRIKRSES